MKPIHALILASLAGVGSFELENTILAPEAHASGFTVPTGPDWREQMIERDPGAAGVNRALEHLSRNLDLTQPQASKIRPLLQQRHDRILGLLLAGPASLTLKEFMARRHMISADMHDHIDAVLTTNQLELEAELPAPEQTREFTISTAGV